jgi:hypothetical protein
MLDHDDEKILRFQHSYVTDQVMLNLITAYGTAGFDSNAVTGQLISAQFCRMKSETLIFRQALEGMV